MFGKPPEIVPDDLSAREYNELAHWYEELKMYSQARESFSRVIAMGPDDPLAVAANRILATRFPANDIPESVVNQVQRAELNLTLRPATAKKAALKLLNDHPNYEDTHRLVAELHGRHGDLAACLEELDKALAINPSHLPTLTLMARAQAAQFSYAEATKYINQALAISPQDQALRTLRRTIENLAGMEDESCPIEDQVGVLCKNLLKLKK